MNRVDAAKICQLQTALYKAMMDADREAASAVVDEGFRIGLDTALVLELLLDPSMAQIGELWGKKQVALSQGYVAAKIAEDVLVRCAPKNTSGDAVRHKGTVVIGNIEDDFHSLGRRMIVPFLEAAGWKVIDLGNDVLPRTFLAAADEHGANILGVSAMMQSTALNILNLRRLINEQGGQKRLPMAVGGAVFNWRPDLVEKVGGDGSARNASGVDSLLSRLCGLSAAMQEAP